MITEPPSTVIPMQRKKWTNHRNEIPEERVKKTCAFINLYVAKKCKERPEAQLGKRCNKGNKTKPNRGCKKKKKDKRVVKKQINRKECGTARLVCVLLK